MERLNNVLYDINTEVQKLSSAVLNIMKVRKEVDLTNKCIYAISVDDTILGEITRLAYEEGKCIVYWKNKCYEEEEEFAEVDGYGFEDPLLIYHIAIVLSNIDYK